jgi:hypothetical protein
MSATLHVLLVLYSAGLGPSGVVRFHQGMAVAERLFRETLGEKLALELEVAQVDRPLADDDFLTDETGRRRLDPKAVGEDLERRGSTPKKYPLVLAFFRAEGSPTHALAVEKEREALQVSLAAEGPYSIEAALAEAVGLLLQQGGESAEEVETFAGTPRDRLQALLHSASPSAWSRLGSSPPRLARSNGLAPLFQRVLIPAGNRSVYLSFIGRAAEKPRLHLGAKTTALEPLGGAAGDAWGAWIDLPSGAGTGEALVGGVPLIRVERARVGYVAARWKESSRGPSILEAEVREEALGGSLRVPRAKLTVKGEARLVLREFPGATHMGQYDAEPFPVEVAGELSGWRLKPARLSGAPPIETARAAAAGPPSGTWILGVVRP